MQTVIGAFDDRSRAEHARERLLQAGFTAQDVHIEQQEPNSPRPASQHGSAGMMGFFASLFAAEDQANTGHASTYDEAVRRGSAVVVVDARDEMLAGRACELLHEAGAVDVDERSRQWRSEGWSGGEATQPRSSLDRGGVRVMQRSSPTPMHEHVRTHRERSGFAGRDDAMGDPARRRDLDSQRTAASAGGTTRERAVASDLGEAPMKDRDPDGLSGSTANPRKRI